MDELSESIHRYLTSAPESQLFGEEVKILDHWQGSDNLLWLAGWRRGEAVVKFFLDAGQVRSQRQFEGQQLFAPTGIAPEPLWLDRAPVDLTREVLVYRWVDGDPLDPTDSQQVLALAEAVAQVHSADPAAVRRLCPRPVNLDYYWRVFAGGVAPVQRWLQAQRLVVLADAFAALASAGQAVVAATLASWEEIGPALVHGDLRLENCVNNLGVAVLMDWEMFGLGDPALEVAIFLRDAQNRLQAPLAEEWLDLYLSRANRPGLLPQIETYGRILPLEQVGFLLNGARTLAPEERTGDDMQAGIEFLVDTFAAAVQDCAATLQIVGLADERTLRQAYMAALVETPITE